MASFGNLEISPSEAQDVAHRIRSRAEQIRETLNKVSEQINLIDNSGETLYSGNQKARELRENLENFRASFNPLCEQIISYADSIEATATMAQNQ